MSSPFTIKDINMFSSWTYNLPKNNECTICRCSLNVPSLYNQEKCCDSYVVTGKCQHSYHYECIKPWVDKNNHCPICAQPWMYQQPPPTTTLIHPTSNEYIDAKINKLSNNINQLDAKINNLNELNKEQYIKKKISIKYK